MTCRGYVITISYKEDLRGQTPLSVPPADYEKKWRVLYKVSEALESKYGVPDTGGLDDPLEVLIRTILSQNTNDRNRDLAYGELQRRFPRWEDIIEADTDAIAEAIKIGGLNQQKAKRIKEVLGWVQVRWGGMTLSPLCNMETEEAMDILLDLKGVGPKTANCVLAFGCGRDVFPVDTHILRVTKRLGLIPAQVTTEQAHKSLAQLVPPGKAIPLHLNLIRYGREQCKVRQPRCGSCLFPELCTLSLEQRGE
ncbi:MAG: endonuclease III [Deltaproteobacteria bacterium]|nr:endonuclease III [Deltaproteobacteria bacterium]